MKELLNSFRKNSYQEYYRIPLKKLGQSCFLDIPSLKHSGKLLLKYQKILEKAINFEFIFSKF